MDHDDDEYLIKIIIARAIANLNQLVIVYRQVGVTT